MKIILDLNISHNAKTIVRKPILNVFMIFVLLLGFVILIEADIYDERLLRFRFHPVKNSSCYQVYTSKDKVDGSSCENPHEESKRSCVAEIKGIDDYCKITTPSGESVKVPCISLANPPRTDSLDIDYSYKKFKSNIECFEVYKNGSDPQELCPKVLPRLATGIVTPDGYTILLQSSLCKTYKSKAEIKADKEFMSTFSFDPEERSCYKFYTADQPISSYSCFENNDDINKIYNKIYTNCVGTWEENDKCSVVKSQNNETIVLECEGQTNSTKNCLRVYKDGNAKEVCMEILAEGCMGITTPSGLRMLFACRTCNSYKGTIVTYDKEMARRRRKFIKSYLTNEQNGKNSYYRNYFQKIVGRAKAPVFPKWLLNSSCYGLALEHDENVLFKCTDREFSQPGCFKVTNAEGKRETDICAFIYEENCILVKTPKGNKIILGCFDEQANKAQIFLKNELQNFKNGIYTFHDTGTKIKKLYRTGKNCQQYIEDYQTQWLHEHQCWGTVTPDLETILLECPNSEYKNKTNCFQVNTQNYGSDRQILPFSYEIYETCLEIIDDLCVGIITRKGWHVQLSCFEEE